MLLQLEDAKNQLHQDVGVVSQPSSESLYSRHHDPLSFSLPADISARSPVDDSLSAFKVNWNSGFS